MTDHTKALADALEALLAGNEWRCLQGEWAWHAKQIPSNAALTKGRKALAAYRAAQQAAESTHRQDVSKVGAKIDTEPSAIWYSQALGDFVTADPGEPGFVRYVPVPSMTVGAEPADLADVLRMPQTIPYPADWTKTVLRHALEAIEAGASAALVMNVDGVKSNIRALLAAPSQPAAQAEPVAVKFACWDADNGLETFDTQAEALEYANETLREYRKQASFDGEWADDVDSMWAGAIHITHKPSTTAPDDEGGVDYVLQPVASQPAAQGIDEREGFATWANRAGYDTAHTYDTDRSRWVFLNPMTADLWTAWQARAAQAPAAEPQWQPIETAPKDGSMFLCWVSAVRYGESDEGQQYQQDASQVDFCWWRDGVDGNGYFDPACGQIADAQDVTHWMPLPPAPEAAKEQP